ncbi:MAG: TRAM domain-containing protein [Arcanobacterium sp.]
MDEIHVETTDFAHGGMAVGRYDGRVVFIRGALPGELVTVRITQERSNLLRAVTTQVLRANEHRVDVEWEAGQAGVTGAADLSHAALEYQRELKTHVLHSTFRRIGTESLMNHIEEAGIGLRVHAVGRGNGWHTRTRADLVKTDTGFGMYRERTHEIVELDRFPLGVPEINELVFEKDWNSTFAAGERVRVVAPSRGATLAVSNGKAFQAPSKPVPNRVLETVSYGGRTYTYQVTADGFWQVHYRAPRELVTLVMDGAQVQPGERVVELFSGAGLFSLPLAQAVGQRGALLTVEGSTTAVRDARRQLRDYPWARARSGRINSRNIDLDADVFVADPPRKGLGVELARAIGGSRARRIVLVSCDPAAAARDLATLVGTGWQLVSVQGRDIFEHTHHMEIVSVLV